MKADNTRFTFDRRKHYTSVRMQQGRVQLDADWNEQLDITAHRVETEASDVVGKCGAPKHLAGFDLIPQANNLQISAGRYYVDGILCQNEEPEPVMVTKQPDLPENAAIVRLMDNSEAQMPPPAGVYLGYLDVWLRHITALEDPEIREVALGGPDTATRTKTVWQVKLLHVGDLGADINCLSELPSWDALVAPATGKLAARAEESEEDKPCSVAAGAGYRRLENQLYRVEVHTEGTLGSATFKWSRDNGSIIAKWESQDGDNLTLSSIGRDKVLNFAGGQWVELTDDTRELLGQPGTLVELEKVDGQVLKIKPGTATGPIGLASFSKNPKVRRWDSVGELEVEIPVANEGWIPLEDGIQIRFAAGSYKTGDYWLIPARTAMADVEWPKDKNNPDEPEKQPPHGITHHYCRLAILQFDGTNWTKTPTSDCRDLFPPLTDICAEDVCFDANVCETEHPSAGWDEVETVQQALDRICEKLGVSERCHDFIDDLRADGVVAGPNGEMGFVVSTTAEPLKIRYTGGIAYVAGCRYEIAGGTRTVDTSTTYQTLLINALGEVQLITKGALPEKYATIAVISTFQGEIKRIIDTRFDLTHLDNKVESNFQRTTDARTDRRQFVPLLAYSINGLQYRDGRDRNFALGADPLFGGLPHGLISDGDGIWVSNFSGGLIARIAREAADMSEIQFFDLGIQNGRSWAVAFDGCCLWFTLFAQDRVVRLNPATGESREIVVGPHPRGIAFDGDFMWVCSFVGQSVSVIDVETCQVVRTIATSDQAGAAVQPDSVSFDGTHIWIASAPNNLLFKIEKPWGDPVLVAADVPHNRGYLVFDGSHIWISSINGPLVKVDITSHEQEVVLPDIQSTRAIAFDGAFIWALQAEGPASNLLKIDVNTDQLLGQSDIPGRAFAATFDGTHLWISSSAGVLKRLV